MAIDQATQRALWRAGEFAQIDRDLRRVGETFERAALFLATHDEGGALLAEATALGERTRALRERCAKSAGVERA